MTAGVLFTAVGAIGAVATLLVQAALVPVFRRQRKRLLQELSKE